MKLIHKKQILTVLDTPSPRPASMFGNLDLSYAINSFQPGNHNIDDIPSIKPVYDEKTSMIKRYTKKKPKSRKIVEKRLVSMPALPKKMQKDLPQIPTFDKKRITGLSKTPRSTSLYIQPGSHSVDSFDSEEIELDIIENEPDPQSEVDFHHKTKHIITDNDEDIDSLFSNNSSANLTVVSSIPSPSKSTDTNKTGIYPDMIKTFDGEDRYRPIIDFVQTYIPPDGDCEPILPSEGINGSDYIHEVPNKSYDDISSFEDSLFGSYMDEVNLKPRIVSLPVHVDYSYHPNVEAKAKMPYDTQPARSPPTISQPAATNITGNSNIKMKKVRRRIASSANRFETDQNYPSKAHELNQPIRGDLIKQRPFSCCLGQSNLSNTSVAVSLHEAKKELKDFARQRPFTYCLDSKKDYQSTRYYIPAKDALRKKNVQRTNFQESNKPKKNLQNTDIQTHQFRNEKSRPRSKIASNLEQVPEFTYENRSFSSSAGSQPKNLDNHKINNRSVSENLQIGSPYVTKTNKNLQDLQQFSVIESPRQLSNTTQLENHLGTLHHIKTNQPSQGEYKLQNPPHSSTTHSPVEGSINGDKQKHIMNSISKFIQTSPRFLLHSNKKEMIESKSTNTSPKKATSVDKQSPARSSVNDDRRNRFSRY